MEADRVIEGIYLPHANGVLALAERCVGAFVGLAIGDAYGRPLEFSSGATARTFGVGVEPGSFFWTDDTHMSMYLGRAILDLAGAPFDEDAFGHAVGRRFVEWSHDPLTPSTAPGRACLAGAERYELGGDWRASGDPDADGCGAIMRIAPVAMAFSGETLTRAAEISAIVTHGHANAREASIAGAHLLRWVLEGEAFRPELVERAVRGLRGAWARGGTVARSLEEALAVGRDSGARWLAEKAVWPGDGGWRNGSALGLSIAAALAWGDEARVAIDRAARIDGDSDSVACLVGMLLGGAGGVGALPSEMVAAVPERAEIERIARSCAALGGAP